MEEDIKYLNNMVKEYKQFGDLHNPEYEDADRIYIALENLIKGYRELERENKLLKKVDEIVENINIKEMALKIEKDDSIQKSKIKEKIEEINSELEEKYSAEKISVFSGNTYMEKFKLLGKLQALQELMEDK